MKRILTKLIIVFLSLFCLLPPTQIYAASKLQGYTIDVASLNTSLSKYLTSLNFEQQLDGTYSLYINNSYVGSKTGDPMSFNYYPNSLTTIGISISPSNETVNFSFSQRQEEIYNSAFVFTLDAEGAQSLTFYPSANSTSGSETRTVKGSGGIFDFGSFSCTLGTTSITFSVVLNANNNTATITKNGSSSTYSVSKTTTTRTLYFENFVEGHPLDMNYMEKNLAKQTFANAKTIDYSDSDIDAAVQNESLTLINSTTNKTYSVPLRRTITYWNRVSGGEWGTGTYGDYGGEIQVVCEWYDAACSSIRAKYGEDGRLFAVYGSSATYPTVTSYTDTKLEYPTLYHNVFWPSSWTYSNASSELQSALSEEYTIMQYRAQSKSWTEYSAWSTEYRPQAFAVGYSSQSIKGKQAEFYRYRTYGWEDATDWNLTESICEYAGDGKYITKTGEDEKCGQEIKWYEFSNYGAASKTTYGETGGCNSYYGANEVCGKYVKWYEFSNYGGASASMYGETGGCNSYYGASSVCGYKTCATSACGYNTCEAQSCGYATCTNGAACGYKTCRTSACGTESYVSSYTCANYHSKTCSSTESYSCNCKNVSCNCRSYSCNCKSTCKRCYVGSTMETNCSYCGSTSSCSTCQTCSTCQSCSTCTRTNYYDCSYTTYDGACYGTRNKECANSACGANTCTSATCGYKKCEDSSCGAKTCTSSACGNKECTWYTCPSSKTPVYGTNECTWYTCPSSKTPVYGNKSCTLYKCQRKSYSAWSGYDYKDGCPTIPGGVLMECDTNTQTKYSYSEQILGDWSDWFGTSKYWPSTPEANYEHRYKLATSSWDKVKGSSTILGTGNYYTGESKKSTTAQYVTDTFAKTSTITIGSLAEMTAAQIAAKTEEIKQALMLYNAYNTIKSDDGYTLYQDVIDYKNSNSKIASQAQEQALDYFERKTIFIPYMYITSHNRAVSAPGEVSGYDNQTLTSVTTSEITKTATQGMKLIPYDIDLTKDTKIIYYDYRDPLINYKDELPENWQGYEELISELQHSDLTNYKIEIEMSRDDLQAMKDYLKTHNYESNDCEMLREFSYIFKTTDSDLAKFLATGKGCKIEGD